MTGWFFTVGRALRNLVVAMVRDPVWAIICIVTAPLRAWRHIWGTFIVFVLTTVGMLVFSLVVEHFLAPHGHNLLLDNVLGILTRVVVLRLSFAPLIQHFGYDRGIASTHGSARFGSKAEALPLVRATSGLLIGRGAIWASCAMTARPTS